MIFKEIVFGSEEFRQEIALRDRVLREPLGLVFDVAELESEKEQLHFGLFAPDGEVIACVVAVLVPPDAAKIRQMAVVSERQGQSLGRTLMRQVETELLRRGVARVFLHARVPVVPFYEKLGYEKQGAEFIEIGIPHVEMAKTIRNGTAETRSRRES